MRLVDIATLRAGHLYIENRHGGCRPHGKNDR